MPEQRLQGRRLAKLSERAFSNEASHQRKQLQIKLPTEQEMDAIESVQLAGVLERRVHLLVP